MERIRAWALTSSGANAHYNRLFFSSNNTLSMEPTWDIQFENVVAAFLDAGINAVWCPQLKEHCARYATSLGNPEYNSHSSYMYKSMNELRERLLRHMDADTSEIEFALDISSIRIRVRLESLLFPEGILVTRVCNVLQVQPIEYTPPLTYVYE